MIVNALFSLLFSRESAESDFMTLEEFMPKPPVDHLFRYLRGTGRMVPLDVAVKS